MKSLIHIALSQYGVKEILGKNKDNPQVINYLESVGAKASQLHDETAWCSAFVNWVCINAGKSHSGKLNARSWLDIGQPINPKIITPTMGDVVVFWRGKNKNEKIPGSNLKKGHVGFYIRDHKSWIYVLGGNQDNQVCIKAYPKNRFLGLRRI